MGHKPIDFYGYSSNQATFHVSGWDGGTIMINMTTSVSKKLLNAPQSTGEEMP